jgi:diguanylate cyclase (GGDEF)-like protein
MPFQSRIRTGKRLFLILSFLLIVTDGLFVWINRHSDQEELYRQLHVESDHLRHLFEIQVTATATRMQQTAAYIAMDRDVQQLFLKGRLAVEAEGGGAGRTRAAEARQALLQRLQSPWEKMQREYDTRQLHFVFGEQATSFLRLHATDRYGDPLASARFVIRDAIIQRKPTMGYESGRIFSGIRGVVPVFAHTQRDDTETFVGVLEAGTSFSVMLQQLEKASSTHFAVLLHRDHLEEILFPERLRAAEATGHFHGDWFIESTTSANAPALLDSPEVKSSLSHHDVSTLKAGNENFAIYSFPLRDYLGGIESQRAAVGTVLAWRSIDAEVALQRHHLVVNLFYAFGAFLLIEVLLYSGIRLTTRHLNGIIEQQTEELRKQAIHDRLTGLYNRHHLDEAFSRECARAMRYREPLSIAILDLDHFKRVNDEHGHLVGDQVLADFAHLIGQNLRAADLVFRYGGEEFLILLANTPQHSAREACEHIRTSLMESSVGGLPIGNITVSIGVTTMNVGESPELGLLLQRADSALYRAKASGRNRVEEEKI